MVISQYIETKTNWHTGRKKPNMFSINMYYVQYVRYSSTLHSLHFFDETLVAPHLAGWPLLCLSSGQTVCHGLNKEKNKCWLYQRLC